ncbi:MAG TPA: carboxypeptidase-like regulatory domain-containing protein [Acidobacteriaceae bacterium]
MKNKKLSSVFVGLAACIALGMCLPLGAQISGGVVAGAITDSSGAAIKGAAVKATNEATHVTAETKSGSTGAYRFTDIPVGIYSVTVGAPGFETTGSNSVVVQLQTTTTLNFALSVGSTTQTVYVTAASAPLETQSSEIGTVVSPEMVEDLPLSIGSGSMRNAGDFVFLAPATYGVGTSGGDYEFSLSGSQTQGSEILLDGASMQTLALGDAYASEELPSVDSVQEFKVFTAGIPAGFGRTGGGIQSYITKAGGLQFHGGAYEVFRNTALDANTWFNNAYASLYGPNPAYKTPPDKKNEYGLTLGGPIWIPKIWDGRKKKSFFFFSWEQFRQTVGFSQIETVPTMANRTGNFADSLTTTVEGTSPCSGQPIYYGEIFNPATVRPVGGILCRDPFPGNIITTPLSAAALNVTKMYPEPTNPGLTNNYSFAGSYPVLDTAQTIRIDQTLRNQDHIFVSYNVRDNNRYYTGTPNLPEPLNAGASAQDLPSHLVRVGYTHIFSPTVVNSVVAGFDRVVNNLYYHSEDSHINWDGKLGIPSDGLSTFYPGLNWGDIYVNPGCCTGGFVETDNMGSLSDVLTISRGRHNISVGGEYRNEQSNGVYQGSDSGVFDFDRNMTASDQLNYSNTGNGYASFLLGQVLYASATRELVGQRNVAFYTALFGQDEFQLNKDLHLSLGVRYSIDAPFKEAHGNTSNFSPTTPNPGAAGYPGALIFAGQGAGRSGANGRWSDIYYGNIEPRIGFAYVPSWLHGRTVLQANYQTVTSPLAGAGYELAFGGISAGFSTFQSVANIPSGYFIAGEYLDTGGAPIPSDKPVLDPSQLNNNGINYIAPSFGRPGMNQTWSASVQQQFGSNTVFTLGYLGQHGTHLNSNVLLKDSLDPKYFSLGKALQGNVAGNTVGVVAPFAGFYGTVAQALTPYPQYTAINTANYGENFGQSSYEALTAKLDWRLHAGLQFLASYTWSKNLGDVGSVTESQYGAYATYIQNPQNMKAEKSYSGQDTPQIFVLSYVYRLPFGAGQHFLDSHALNKVVGGWQIGGIQRYQSGQVQLVSGASGVPSYEGSIRWNLVPGQQLLAGRRKGNGGFNPFTDRWYNAAALSDPNSSTRIAAGGAYQFGNMPRYEGYNRAFPYLDEDFSVTKTTAIAEGINVQFRAELFNAFNRHIFGGPYDGNPYDTSSFGVVNSTQNSPRNVQFTLKLQY